MASVAPCAVPDGALLGKYVKAENYTDCYAARVPRRVMLDEFVLAFYASRLFALERLILKWAVSKPSDDADIQALADGTAIEFAAWSVEKRTADELLLRDFQGRTRSWLKCAPPSPEGSGSTELFFGSAVVFGADGARPVARSKALFNALLPFHKVYSRGLLWSAIRNLRQEPCRD